MEKKRILLLVDGDMIAFSHAAAEEYGKPEEEINFAKIVQSMDSKMKFLINRLEATDYIVCFSDSTNFRHVLEPNYKANRDGVWRPVNLKNAKAMLMTAWEGCWKPGIEADDLLGMLAKFKYDLKMGKRGEIKSMTNLGPRTDYDEVIIATLDKDIPQIGKANPAAPGAKIKHYRWETPHAGEKLRTVEGFGELKCIIKQSGKTKKKEIKGNGAKFFLHQMLIGDSTDGIMGCGNLVDKIYKTGAKAGQAYQRREGVGAVESFELLDKATTYAEGLQIVMQQYRRFFGANWEKEFILTGRLVYMAIHMVEGTKVRLWHYDPKVVEYVETKTMTFIPHQP